MMTTQPDDFRDISQLWKFLKQNDKNQFCKFLKQFDKKCFDLFINFDFKKFDYSEMIDFENFLNNQNDDLLIAYFYDCFNQYLDLKNYK